MCYSAQIIASYKKFVRHWGATMTLREFVRDLWLRESEGAAMRIPKAIEADFLAPESEGEREALALIEARHARLAAEWEAELFRQRKRLADAERSMASKPTKAAAESQRIASEKVERLKGWLADLHRTEPKDRDARIYPGWYAPVMVWEDGRRVVKPMRYQCRPAGKPASYDRKFPGTYNARRDNLEGFWKGLFGRSHGIMIVERFFENVQRDGKNVVLEFKPQSGEPMLVACLWSRWTAPGEPELLSFAAITDEPPAEVAAAGHDRCIVPIKPENIDAWLRPDPGTLQAQYAILDDRERPYYEHRMAA